MTTEIKFEQETMKLGEMQSREFRSRKAMTGVRTRTWVAFSRSTRMLRASGSSGTSAQADELTRIVGQRRIPSAKEPAGAVRYDWDRIIVDARLLLADRQMEDFIAAIEYRRASEKMAALAAKRR